MPNANVVSRWQALGDAPLAISVIGGLNFSDFLNLGGPLRWRVPQTVGAG
jgi:hypothetical protein